MRGGFYSPGASVLSLIVAGALSLIGGRRKTRRIPVRLPPSSPIPAHPGWHQEVIDVQVIDPVKAKRTQEFGVGSEIRLEVSQDELFAVVGGIRIKLYSDHVKNMVKDGCQFHAYIKEREGEFAGFYDFFDVVVFFAPSSLDHP